jgi:class 3 adenylate cyclase
MLVTFLGDAARAIKASNDIHSTLRKDLISCHIGVATGTAFCGNIGNNHRGEYAIVGDSVNLAARLMGAAAKYGHDILCDSATASAASKSRMRQLFKALDPIHVKGKEHAIQVFVPLGDATSAALSKVRIV